MSTAAVFYALAYAAAALPGLAIGIALFGRRHPAAYVAGAVLGYAFTTIALGCTIALGGASRLGFASAWAIACLAGLAAARGVPRLRVFPWTRGDTFALVLLTALTLTIALPPFARVGARQPNGSRLYRAYFTADFVWHMSLAAELGKFETPVRNPYLAREPIHYYWGYFVVPAVIAARGPVPLRSVETCLKGNAIATGLLFTAALYMLARLAVPRPAAAAIAVALAFLASSAEGLYETWRMWSAHIPLFFLRHTNIDAVSNWQFHGLRIDGLQRCLWYVPQHMMSYTAGIAALVIGAAGGAAAPLAAILVAGLVLAASVMCNPLVGAMFAVGYAGSVTLDAVRSRTLRRLPVHALAAVPVVAAVAWCSANHMLEGSSHALSFGLHGLARHAPLASLAVSLGPLLVLALVGALLPLPGSPLGNTVPALVMVPLSLGLMHFLMLDVDTAYIGFRAGHILICVAVMLVARAAMGVFSPGWRRPASAALLIGALAAGLPTTAIDWYNARDIANREKSIGGFRWTIEITAYEQEAFRWIRSATPARAIVQMEPMCRGRETWSLIPSFAERRMAAGEPISLLHVQAYDDLSRTVQKMYSTESAAEAHQIAEDLGIDFIYVDLVERSAYPRGVEKFNLHPELFAPVFANRDTTVYAAR